jgi:uncharacterized protein
MKKNKIPLTQSLSERELNWLQNYLDTLSRTNADFMTLEEIDGLFCALIINPVMAKPADWMNTIFGKKQAFNSDEELENVMMLLVRYWNHASTAIENNQYVPRPLENTQKWAFGFHLGMDYCRKEWDLFLTETENVSLLSPFTTLEEAQDIITEEKRLALLAQIPPIVHNLFHYWVEKATNDKKETKAKVGRNDPCPCGSGKKYKKCCDA